MTNYYQCLGVTNSASSEQVKIAYKEYAKNFHPDKHDNSEFFKQRFQEIQQAYEVLADSTKRKAHDLKLARQVIVDDTKIKELNLKVSKLETTIKQKNDSVSNLLALITKNDTELKVANNKLSDYLNQIRVLTEYIAAEKERVRRKKNPFIGLVIGLQKYAFIIYVVFGIVAVVAISTFVNKQYGFGENKINMVKVGVMADSLVKRKEYSLIADNVNKLIASKVKVDTSTIFNLDSKAEQVDLYTVRAMAYELDGNTEAAKEDVDYVIANRHSPSAYAYYRRACLNFKSKNKEALFFDLNRAIRIKPFFVAAYALRGNAYYRMGDAGQAIKDFRRVNDLKPNDSKNLNNIGDCYFAMQKFTSACSIWKKANDLGSKEAYHSLRRNCR